MPDPRAPRADRSSRCRTPDGPSPHRTSAPLAAWLRPLALVVLSTALLVACAEDPEPGPAPEYEVSQKPLQAYCQANVEGYGMVDMETDYLPRVIRCENGSAPLEALKAQAVAARGYAYYKMSTSGSLAPDTSDQKYDCAGDPSQIHYDAVAATAGQYVEYQGTIVASFYVAGAIPGNRSTCVAVSGDNDYSNTEHYVTYNEGKYWDPTGGQAKAEQTTLGWVNDGNHANRGCKSQNGAACLAEAGWGHERILRFYYGENIELPVATGACVGPPPMCEIAVDGAETIIDQSDTPCFSGGCQDSTVWNTVNEGYGGSHIFTYAWDQGVDCAANWNLEFTTAGEYDVHVYIDTSSPLTESAPYTVRHDGQETPVTISQAAENGGWASLGRFQFAQGGDQWVRLVDNTGEPYTGTDGKRIVFDAVRLTRVDTPPMDPGTSDTGAPPQDTGSGGTDTASGTDTNAATDTSTASNDTNEGTDTSTGGQDTLNAPDATMPNDTSGTAGDTAGVNPAQPHEVDTCACASLADEPQPGSRWWIALAALALVGLRPLRRRRSES